MPVPSVLFVCNLNRVRSPMAAALMRRAQPDARVDSCGVEPAESVDPFVVGVLHELGVDLMDHEPKSLDEVDAAAFDRVIALSPEAHAGASKRFGPDRVEYWPTTDPTLTQGSRDQRMDAYRQTRSELERRLSRLAG